MNVAIIYWTGTGNTLAMAEAIKEGAESNGANVKLIEVDSASMDDVTGADRVAFGCPAMGDEVLEEMSFRPFMDEANKVISGKDVAIFGSYEWNDGQWILDWEEEIKATGANLIAPGLKAYDNPDADAIEACKELGAKLAK